MIFLPVLLVIMKADLSFQAASPVTKVVIKTGEIIRRGFFFTTDTASAIQSTVQSVPQKVKVLSETAKGVQDSLLTIPTVMKDLQEKVNTVPTTVLEIQSTVQSVPSKIADSIESTTKNVADAQKSIAANVEYTATILDPKNIQKNIEKTKQDVELKINNNYQGVQDTYSSIQKAYVATVKALTPQTHMEYYKKIKEENEEKTYRQLVKKQEERNNARKLVNGLYDMKATLYSTVDTVTEVKEKATSMSEQVVDDIESFVDEVKAIPTRIEAIIREIQAVPGKIEASKKNAFLKLRDIKDDLLRIQATMEDIVRDVQSVPSSVQQTYISTKTSVEAIPSTIKREIEQKKRAAAELAAICWRILTLQDVIAAFVATQRVVIETTEKISSIPNMFKPKPKVVLPPPPPVKKSVPVVALEKTWEVLTVVVASLKSFFTGVSNLKARVDNDWKRLEEREKTLKVTRPQTTFMTTTKVQKVTSEPIPSPAIAPVIVAATPVIQEVEKKYSEIPILSVIDGDDDVDAEFFTTVVTPAAPQPKNSTMISV